MHQYVPIHKITFYYTDEFHRPELNTQVVVEFIYTHTHTTHHHVSAFLNKDLIVYVHVQIIERFALSLYTKCHNII